MKIVLALVVGVCVWIALGAVLPFTSMPAVIVTLLGKYGAFSYRGLAGICTTGALFQRL